MSGSVDEGTTDTYRPGREMSHRVASQLRQRRDTLRSRWRRDPGREASLIIMFLVVLATLLVGAFTAKVDSFSRLGRGDQATYWMESAQRYRYVDMVARGEPIPRIDARMQAPDGYVTASDTIGQEWIYGHLAQRRPDDWSVSRFVRFLTRLVAVSAMIPMAWLGWVLTRRRDAALVAALLYGFALPVVERGNGAVLFREDLAFPVLLCHLAALAGWARAPRWPRALLAGLLLALSLLLWKVVSFYALLLLVFLAIAWWLEKAEPRVIALTTSLLFGPAAIASLGPWSLRYDQFLMSTQMLGAVGIVVGCVLGWRKIGPRWLGPLLLVGIVTAGRALLPDQGSYDHAWETILAKLSTFDQKPLDPLELSFHARHYWTGNYESPTLRRLARDWPWLLAVGLPGVFALLGQLRRGGAPWPGPIPPPPTKLFDGDGPSGVMSPLLVWFTLWLVGSFLAVYFMFVKLTLFAAVALAALGALGWSAPRRLRVLRRLATLPFLVGVVLHGVGLAPALEGAFVDPDEADQDGVSEVVVFPPDAFQDLAAWVTESTEQDEAFLASFQISPFLLTYLDRPTVLHCFFEGDLLARLEEVVLARFEDEQTLWEVARRYGVTWYVHEAHYVLRTDPRMSQRYVAGAMDWPAESAAVRMQYAPETLKHFELAWENDWFRVFRVLDEGEESAAEARRSPSPLWNRPLFAGLFGDPLKGMTMTEPGRGLEPDDLFYATMKADTWLRYAEANRSPAAPKLRFAEQEYGLQKAVEVAPYSLEGHARLEDLYRAVGRHDRASDSRSKRQRVRGVLRGAVPVTRGDAPREVHRIR